jgi:hypothetical protein
MPESIKHIKLVSALVTWISTQYFSGDKGRLLIDSPEYTALSKPKRIDGYVPDIFALKLLGGGIVIGEAKTARDLDNKHTRYQIEAFMKYCAIRPGSVLVIAVPWYLTRYARSLLCNISRSCGCDSVSTEVLDQLEG